MLKTEHLILRHPKLEDAPIIFSIVNSPEFPEQLPLKEMDSLPKVENWLNRLIELWDENRLYSWIIEEHISASLLGQITLSKIEENNKWALAFWIHPDHWGKGYATEGAKRTLKFGFEELRAETIWAGAAVWNAGSNRVLEKLGMAYLNDNPQGYFSKGKPIPTREYEISLETWEGINKVG